jgi:non-ribosomal peptide synthetase component F
MDIQELSVIDNIDRAVREFPDHDALTTADGTVDYARFGELVDGFARRLSARTETGEFVGIDARRGLAAIVAMIGALKAGRPFVFVDERDSVSSNTDKARLLGIRLLARAGADGEVELVELPERWRSGRVVEPPDVDGLAYAIYTSGSTGVPKCVLVRQAPLAAVIRDHVERLDLGPGCSTLQFARLTFDGCVTEIVWTLTAGARLVVLEEQHLAPGAVLQNTLERHRITHVKTTPFALTVTEPSDAMALEHVINGGGACRPAVVSAWSALASFHNAYGLTETTVCNLLTGPLDPAQCTAAVPLGDLVGDCSYEIRPTTGASRGELVITGNSVAAGYLTEQGVQPFTPVGHPTGDVVELCDGELYFVERLDRQVKVRGYRIDPGEVENAVCRMTSVRDAVVLAEAHDGSARGAADALVCYYQGDLDPRAMREHLEGILDPYKVPSVFRHVETLPYTPNGKVDRDALQARRGADAAGGDTATPAEKVLRLVRTLTGVDDAQLDDNFFDVGGDSASAVVLVNKLKQLGWVDAGVRDVLRADDLRELTDALETRRG